MKKSTLTTLALSISALFASQAMASVPQTVGKTRDQVRAELAEAIRTGDMPAPQGTVDAMGIATSGKLNELYPSRYPAKAAAPGKSREQVRSELADAIRTGDLLAPDGTVDLQGIASNAKLKDIYPHRYPAQVVAVSTKTRAEVRAEAANALRNPPQRHWTDTIKF